MAIIQVPVYLVVGAVAGYLVDGSRGALILGGIMAASAGLVGWWLVRRERS